MATIISDTLDGWHLSARWHGHRRRRFRLALLIYLAGARQLAVRVAGVRPGNGPGR